MPSPRNTNRERRFIADRTAKAAYDAAPVLSDESALELLQFLQGKLSDADLGEFCRLAGIDPGQAMDDSDDQPPPFEGRPQRGGFGQDARPSRLVLLAQRITVSPYRAR